MTLRIVSWNINSVRLRLPLLKKLVQQEKPDIVCLQETKVEDALFPLEAIKTLGFSHVHFSGQKSYNGVAVLSKIKLTNVSYLTIAGVEQKRHISVMLGNGIALHNFYVPAGGDIPDPKLNPAYGYKLKFVEEMTAWSKKTAKARQNIVILGDFNIAPMEHDVWSSRQLRNVVSHTEPEITRLNALKASAAWCDVGRHFTDEKQKLYSWWSYRNRDWRKSDRGRRLDHIWVTPSLKNTLAGYDTLKDARDWQQPSDHVPIIATLKV